MLIGDRVEFFLMAILPEKWLAKIQHKGCGCKSRKTKLNKLHIRFIEWRKSLERV